MTPEELEALEARARDPDSVVRRSEMMMLIAHVRQLDELGRLLVVTLNLSQADAKKAEARVKELEHLRELEAEQP